MIERAERDINDIACFVILIFCIHHPQLLDLGDVDPSLPCSDHCIQAMIRSDEVKVGDIYIEPISGVQVEVVDIRG